MDYTRYFFRSLVFLLLFAPLVSQAAVTISLIPDSSIEVRQSESFTDMGGTVFDSDYAAASWTDVVVSGDVVDTSADAGTVFTIIYTYTNPNDSTITAAKQRTVTITAPSGNRPPIITMQESQTAYFGIDYIPSVLCTDPDEGLIPPTQIRISPAVVPSTTPAGGKVAFSVACIDSNREVSTKMGIVTVVNAQSCQASEWTCTLGTTCSDGEEPKTAFCTNGDTCCGPVTPPSQCTDASIGGVCTVDACGTGYDSTTDSCPETVDGFSQNCCVRNDVVAQCADPSIGGTCVDLDKGCGNGQVADNVGQCGSAEICCVTDLDAVSGAGGLVPCSGADCSTCDFVKLGNEIMKWLLGFLFAAFAVMLAVAGYGLVTSGGNPEAKNDAKNKLMNAVVGILMVLAAWLIVDTIVRGLVQGGTGQVNGALLWNEISCSEQAQPGGTGGEDSGTSRIDTPDDIDCNDMSTLTTKYGGIGSVNAPELDTMISCYRNAVGQMIDANQLYTFDRSHPSCNYSNGNPVCESCSHSVNSCHYGRGSGEGAKAVDFNAAPGYSEQQLYQKIQEAQASCGGRLLFEGSHTHVSLDSC